MATDSNPLFIFRSFIDGKEKVERLNTAYLELFQKLYTDHQTSVQIALRCGNFISSKCTRPTQANTVVRFYTCRYLV